MACILFFLSLPLYQLHPNSNTEAIAASLWGYSLALTSWIDNPKQKSIRCGIKTNRHHFHKFIFCYRGFRINTEQPFQY